VLVNPFDVFLGSRARGWCNWLAGVQSITKDRSYQTS